MEAEYTTLASLIQRRAAAHPKSRFLVAVAGAPGSGKTTLAGEVVRRLNTSSKSLSAALLSMDGFHLPRSTLDALPNREEAYVRRGAPFTFDLDAFLPFMRGVRGWADTSSQESISAPSFSHTTKDPVPSGTCIPAETKILIVEGNYLLLDEPGWSEVSTLVDMRVLISVDLTSTRERVARRHVRAGIEKTLDDAYRRVDANDALNGRLVQGKVVEGVDVVVNSVDIQT
jgi:pantothenate kinase